MGYLVQNGRVTVNGEIERALTRLACFKIPFQHPPAVRKKKKSVKIVVIKMTAGLRFERGASQIQIPHRELPRFIAS